MTFVYVPDLCMYLIKADTFDLATSFIIFWQQKGEEHPAHESSMKQHVEPAETSTSFARVWWDRESDEDREKEEE